MKGLSMGAMTVALLGLFSVGSLFAQTPVSFGLVGGASIPSGSTSDGLKTGWHGTALVQFKPATSPV